MDIFGYVAILIGLPLLIGYAISDKKNKMWLRLGILTLIIGLLLIFLA